MNQGVTAFLVHRASAAWVLQDRWSPCFGAMLGIPFYRRLSPCFGAMVGIPHPCSGVIVDTAPTVACPTGGCPAEGVPQAVIEQSSLHRNRLKAPHQTLGQPGENAVEVWHRAFGGGLHRRKLTEVKK